MSSKLLHNRHIVAAVTAVTAVATLTTFTTLASQAQPIKYPDTRKGAQVDTYHGSVVADPYRWLEDDNSAETKAWVTAQNAVTDRFLESMPQRTAVKKIYTELYNYERFGLPFKEGGRYFWSRNNGLQQQAVLYSASSLTAKPTVAIDPNLLSKDGTVALTGAAVSRDGRYMAYGTSAGGSDWQSWQVRDLKTGKDLSDKVQWVKFSSAQWTPDAKGFFYSRYDAPKAGEALTGSNYFQKLYYHRLGTDQSKDLLVYQNQTEKTWRFGTTVTDDAKFVIVSVWKGSGRKNGLLVMPLKNGALVAAAAGTTPLLTITLDFDAEYTPIGSNGNRLWVKADKDAPKGRIIAIDLTKRERANWKTVVAETKDAMTAASVVGGRIFVNYLQDAATLVKMHMLDGKFVRNVDFPGMGSSSGFGGRFAHKETFYSYTSLINPTEIFRYDIRTGKSTSFARPKTAFDSSQYETKREFVTSRDGTRFPIFIAHRKGMKLDGNNPTLLYGYGGFNVSETPSYRVTASTWMSMGGVYATASIRGGGEYGAAWHDAGTKLKKQNVFDDFIAAAEWLVANKYTQPARLAINGGSNGGLLVGAVVNQRPDLFGAAVPQVGVMDMLRFHKFTIGWAWVSDYGSSDNADEFKALAAYSPLHNIRAGQKYPPILITTADHDDRVVPAHSFKYAAAIQAVDTGTAPKLIRIETSAGHGDGKPTSKIIEERSDLLAFIANAFGVDVKP